MSFTHTLSTKRVEAPVIDLYKIVTRKKLYKLNACFMTHCILPLEYIMDSVSKKKQITLYGKLSLFQLACNLQCRI